MPISKQLLDKISQNNYPSSSCDLSNHHTTDQEVIQLAVALRHNTILTSLNLAQNRHLSHEAVRILANNKTLISLDLAHNRIGDEGAQALASNTTLTSLNLSCNEISSEGVQAFARNTTLISLNLCNNQIKARGTQAFANNTTLISLDLSGNQINAKGAQTLASNTTLTSLDLSKNGIGAKGARVLANNTTLTSLSLTYNYIGKRGLHAFQQALKWNKRLLTLNLKIEIQVPRNMIRFRNINISLPDDMTETLSCNKRQNSLRREGARKLLFASRILLCAKSNDEENTLSLASLPGEIIWYILSFIPEKGLLSDEQKNNVIQFAKNKETLNKSHDFLSFLKTTNCLFCSPSFCTPPFGPTHKN